MSVWFAQLAEIRADLFAKRICGLDNTLRFMQLVQEYEEDWFNSLSIFERFKFVYNKKENTHPNLFFRVEQIRKLNAIGFNYKVAHYFRLLWWFITLRGFYGRNAILKEKNAVSMDI
jgi:hypothetical protein